MIIKSLELHNYIIFEDVSLDIGEGVIYLTGENRDLSVSSSNGAGKSLLVESIVWCLFGTRLRKKMKVDDVVGEFGKFARVKVEISKDGKDFEIERFRKHPSHGNKVFIKINGEDFSRHKNNEEFISQQLGINIDVFHYSVFNSSRLDSITSLSPNRLLQAISDMLGLKRFDDYLANARSLKKEVQAELTVAKVRLEGLVENFNSKQAHLETIEAQIKGFDDRKAGDLINAKARLQSLRKRQNSLSEELEGAGEALDRLDELKPSRDKYERFRGIVEASKRELSQMQRKADKLKREKKALEAKKEEEETKRLNLVSNPTGSCMYCGGHLEKTDKTKELVLSYTKNIRRFVTEVIDVDVSLERLEGSIRRKKEFIQENEEETEKHYEGLEQYQEVKAQVAAFEVKLGQLERVEKEIEDGLSKLSQLNKQSAQGLIQSRDHLMHRIMMISAEVSEQEHVVNSANRKVEVLNVLISSLKQIRSGVFNEFIERFIDQINECFVKLTDGEFTCKHKVTKSQLELEFKDSSKNKFMNYHLFSDGEAARIDTAVTVALNKVTGANLYIDDEGLKGIDNADRILEFILDSFSGGSLIFCSHQTSVNDFFKGGRNIHVIKDGGRSSIIERSL